MAEQILTQELLHTLFDYRDGELFWKITKSNTRPKNKRAGCVDSNRYKRIGINRKDYYSHRLIFMMFNGYMPKFIDHIDGNKLNNKIENLREATKKENSRNSPLRSDNTSGVKGVTWSKVAKKWQVQVCVDGKSKYFGLYFDLQVAKFVSETIRHKYHGQFARAK